MRSRRALEPSRLRRALLANAAAAFAATLFVDTDALGRSAAPRLTAA
ncbi:MAG TPA: hypothetical protein VKY73_06660 [Polyangiaceae bacterium]|nr:hypothetical protein [Polyangiaceae bacterium]